MKTTGGDAILVFIFVIAILAVIVAVILGFAHGIRQSKRQLEEARQAEQEAKRQERLEFERREKLRKEQEQKALDRKLARDQTRLNFSVFDENGVWSATALSSSDQDTRMDRAHEQRQQIRLEAYDSRYKTAKIYGTTFNHYLTSASFCTCQDFRRQHVPCKHMYFLANLVVDNHLDFTELDYEKGLLGFSCTLVGRFPHGTATAVSSLQDRGCMVSESRSVKDIDIAVLGESNAVKRLEELQAASVPILKYADALKIFTSEIRHPELEDKEEDNKAN